MAERDWTEIEITQAGKNRIEQLIIIAGTHVMNIYSIYYNDIKYEREEKAAYLKRTGPNGQWVRARVYMDTRGGLHCILENGDNVYDPYYRQYNIYGQLFSTVIKKPPGTKDEDLWIKFKNPHNGVVFTAQYPRSAEVNCVFYYSEDNKHCYFAK